MNHRHDQPEPRGRHRLPRPLRFPVKIISTALVLALTIAFLPRITRLAGRLWPDPARTERVSGLLSHELTESARPETLQVDDRGVLTATVQAALIGEVQRVTVDYDYHASIGIDLTKAGVSAEGGVLTLTLPPFEILSDSLTPTKIDRKDFWYPLTEKRRTQLLNQEKTVRAEAALQEAETSEDLWKRTEETLRGLIDSWIGSDTMLITVEIRRESGTPSEG